MGTLKFAEPDMIYIEGGTFEMGSNNGKNDEKPVHRVTLNSFYIGRYEVTNREYSVYNPGHKGYSSKPDCPVECVSWNDATDYCKWLSKNTGKNYRLPTEAEWEYACRGGTTTEYYWGDNMDDSYCWYINNSSGKIHPVGKKKPNPLGLYDMSGNVWEWCSDWYDVNYYSISPSTNPTGSVPRSLRVSRGGSWDNNAETCRSANRFGGSQTNRDSYLGFRLVKAE
ncbi:MAG: formylglycine-generating enzyme family protein [Candidatus Eremiobacterota bacterium]